MSEIKLSNVHMVGKPFIYPFPNVFKVNLNSSEDNAHFRKGNPMHNEWIVINVIVFIKPCHILS